MTPILTITIVLFLALLVTSFLYWDKKTTASDYYSMIMDAQNETILAKEEIKQLLQTHQAELQEVQDKLLLANSEMKGQQNTIDTLNLNLNKLIKDKLNLESELSELRQFAQDQHEAFVRLNDIYKGLDGSETKQLNPTVSGFSGQPFLTDEQLAEMERLNNQTKIDWSKPVPFPEDYQVPKGVEVVVVSEDRDKKDQWYRPVGIKGVTIECDDTPDCDWEDGKKRIHMICHELAPINPTDHPNHPQFKG